LFLQREIVMSNTAKQRATPAVDEGNATARTSSADRDQASASMGDRPAASSSDDEMLTPAEAAQELRNSLGRVWIAARENVRDIGQAWRRSARLMGEETRHAAGETRDSIGAAMNDMGEVREDLMREARDLSRSVSSNLGRYMRAHPVRTLAIAAVTGAIVAQALRRRH
jgi:hypothetical protein